MEAFTRTISHRASPCSTTVVRRSLRLSSSPLSRRRTLIAPPLPNSGPLMERRSDRALPSVNQGRRWMWTMPLFAVAVGASMLAIFNYQKSSSSVVTSTLYSLRISQKAREMLGDEIYFAHKIPWISGEMNQLHGRINISFKVKGTKAEGTVRFKSTREGRMSYFQTELWDIVLDDGTKVSLLDSEEA